MPFKSYDDSRKQIQTVLKEAGFYTGVIDGDIGILSHKAFNLLDIAHDIPMGGEWNQVKASSFADPADIRGFNECKLRGGTDMECFSEGDNGIGKWGDRTDVDVPMVALPRELWARFPNPRGKKLELQFITPGGEVKNVICELRDTMPSLRNLANAATIDLNPGAQKAIGVRPPFLVSVAWRWV